MGLDEAPNYEELEGYFGALAYSTRLEILRLLRVPHELSEIRLSPKQVRAGENPQRAISRQALLEHIDRLMEIGVVVAREPATPREPREFVVNPQRLYQIIEEFRSVGTVFAGAPAGRGETAALGDVRAAAMEPGPKLVLVHGLLEGKSFRLRREDLKPGRGWVIGRKEGLAASLEYDPFVSLENAEIVSEGGGFALLDLRSSRNGTWLNWRRLEPDERARLESGDVVRVGRSLLVFRSG